MFLRLTTDRLWQDEGNAVTRYSQYELQHNSDNE